MHVEPLLCISFFSVQSHNDWPDLTYLIKMNVMCRSAENSPPNQRPPTSSVSNAPDAAAVLPQLSAVTHWWT